MLGVPAVIVAMVRLGQGVDLSGDLGLLAGGVLILLLSWRVLRCGVHVDGDPIVINNVFSAARGPTRAITEIEPSSVILALRQRGSDRRVFVVADDSRIRVDALNSNDAKVRVDNAQLLRLFLNR
jgi:hypothetical protein